MNISDLEKIKAEIKLCISETREHGKHHAKFVRDNGELYISGLEMALAIIEENTDTSPLHRTKVPK